MGIKANTLRYRSKRDGEIIVGSEIRAALDELENENSELRAQLARCVQALETYRKSFEDGFASSILDSLPEQAKADAEVLRCAEELYQLNVRTPLDTESTTDLVREHVNCVKNVVEAVLLESLAEMWEKKGTGPDKMGGNA